MSQEIITVLELEIKSIDIQIKKLIEQSEALGECIKVYEKYIPEKEVKKEPQDNLFRRKYVKRSVPEKKKHYIPKPKVTPEGKQKFAHYLLDIFKSEPDKIFHSAQLCNLMNDGIQSGKVLPSKKDMSSAVGAYLWNFTQRGLLIKTEKSDTDRSSGYQLSSSAGKIKKHKKSENISSLELLDMFDETIINAVAKADSSNLESICHGIRLSQNFLEISKNISGSLLSSVEGRISNLCRNNIIIESGDNYSVNPKYKYI